MLEFIESIPDVVWAALLASMLTLTGVLLSNRNSRTQTLAQLKHDSHQRDREREMALRQDVYMHAAGAISKGQNILTRLSDLNLSDKEIGIEYSLDSSALSKIQVVGTNKTVQAISAFSQELASAFLELLLKRAPLIERKNSIEFLSKLIDKSQAEQDRNLNFMKQYNLDGNRDQRLCDVLNGNFEFEKKQHEEFTKEQTELWSIQNKEHLNFVKLCSTRFIEVSKLVPATVFTIREELELPIDEDAYLASFNENTEKGMKILESFLKDAAEMVNQ